MFKNNLNDIGGSRPDLPSLPELFSEGIRRSRTRGLCEHDIINRLTQKIAEYQIWLR